MVAVANLALVFVAGLVTALAAGLGALPFFLVEDISDRWNVVLWGVASGIMVAASLFGLIGEGLAVVDGGAVAAAAAIGPGVLAGVALVVVGHGGWRTRSSTRRSTRKRTSGSSCSSSVF